MKSGKQRRLEIKEKRRNTAMRDKGICVYSHRSELPKGALKANLGAYYGDHYRLLPLFYLDKPFVCRNCGIHEIWTAKQQKWWFEIIKANLDSTAIRCRRCRQKLREKKANQKAHMKEMAEVIPHPNEAFFNNKTLVKQKTK